MHILGTGREAFLGFLRNLSPQIFMFSFALVAFNGLEFSCCEKENFGKTFLFSIFSIIFLFSTWANCTVFLDNFLTSTRKIQRAERLLKIKGISGFNLLVAKIKYSIRNARMVIIESAVIIIFMECSFVAVLLASAAAAANFIKLAKGG
jgi:hypothetical protein